MLKGRISSERRSGDGDKGPRETYEPPNFPNAHSNSQPMANGRLSTESSRQRFIGISIRDEQMPNGSLPPSPIDGRNGRETEASQNMPIRERSRTNGSSGGKSSTAALRICSKCNEPLTGQYVRALGGTFHLECFKCQVSDTSHRNRG